MPQSAAAANSFSLPDDPVDAMLALASLPRPFRVFPAAHGGKQPYPGLPSWKDFFATRDPEPTTLRMFRKLKPTPNVAVCLDEHLAVIDIDNHDFAAWFDAQGPERIGTWVVRTQSGGTHVYLRSVEPIDTTVLKSVRGIKIGDVKARGGYVIAPPSIGAQGEYETEYGSPTHIVEVHNARAWFFEQYIDPWEATFPIRIDPMNAPGGNEYANNDVQSPPPVERQQELAAILSRAHTERKLTAYVYVTLTEGSDAPLARDHWKNPDDHSGVDFACVKELIGLEWTFQQVVEWYSFAIIGEPRYRGNQKSRGHGYLLRTFDNAKNKHDADVVNLKNMIGGNWKIVEPVWRFKVEDDIVFEFGVEWSTPQANWSERLRLPMLALGTPQRFMDAALKQGVVLDLGQFDSKATLLNLAKMLRDLAQDKPIPDIATVEGQIRARIHSFVNHNLSAQGRILDAIAWQDQGYVYVNPDPLFKFVEIPLSLRGHRAKVWPAWESLLGTETTYDGRPCWRAPLASFPELS